MSTLSDETPAAPVPVAIVAPAPIPVSISGSSPQPFNREHIQRQGTDPSLPAQTTFQQDLMTAGQRNINLMWETTQRNIALAVILGTMIINGFALLLSMALTIEMTAAQALLIGFVNSLATGVMSFYFSRTNHQKIGGVGFGEAGR